ncbi:MAG: MarR family winged helix-turn-helix transcriptional regulator [Rubrobacteraceae bacterium]
MVPDRHDRVDGLMGFLRGEDPARATSAKALSYRLRRASHYIDREIRRELAPLRIELWELEILAALRRAGGQPYQLTSGALLEEAQLTSGAITKRVARLERKGWVRREIAPDDRRQILVILTDEGLERTKTVFGAMSKTEESLLDKIDGKALDRMNDDLRDLLLQLEGPAPPTPR